MKVKKTYSRKNQEKPKRSDSKSVTVNVYNLNLIVNITNVSSKKENTESSKSESSDLFDKLVKGPMYNNRNNYSSSGPSEYSRKFFSQRQDTATFYKSDAELSTSTDISNHLFRDSQDSDIYMPSWPSPPEYCKIKNKLVKITKEKKVTVNINKIKQAKHQKKTYRVEKKRHVTRQDKAVTKEKSLICTSSTPNEPKAVLDRDTWPDRYVSPIMPPLYPTRQNHNIGNQNSVLGVTALIEGLGNLGIETPHRKKSVPLNIKYCENQEPELFDYKSPINFKKVVSVSENCQSEESNEHDSQKSHVVVSSENVGSMNPALGDDMNSSEILLNNCESVEEMSSSSGVFTPQLKKFEEGHHEGQLCCQSPEAHKVLQCSSITTPCTNALRNSVHLTVNNKEKNSSKVSSPYPEKEIVNEFSEEIDTRSSNLSSCKEINSDSSFDSKIESCNIKNGNSEEYSDSSYLNGSLPSLEGESDQCHPEQISGYNNIKNPGVDDEPEVNKENAGINILNDSNHQELPVPEFKTNREREKIKPQTYQEASGSIQSSCIMSPAKVLKLCESRPLSDLTNLSLVLSNPESTREICKRSIPSSKEKKRIAQYSMKDSLSLQPPPARLNETLVELNLEAGKRWRRSLLRQKQPEATFDRRKSISSETLVRLIKESRILSSLTNDTKFSYNSTLASVLEDQEVGSSSILSASTGSPGFNLTFSKLSKIQIRRRMYKNDMNEIPEEISDHSTSICNEMEFDNQSVPLQDQASVVQCQNADSTLNQTDIYETPPLLRMNPEALSAITDRKRSRRNFARSLGECSMFSDVSVQNETDEENQSFASCCNKLELEEELENLNDQNIGKVGFLLRCGQEGPISFMEAFSEEVLSSGQKIGEGVFGEVFMLNRPGKGRSVIKIIPIEGNEMVNNEPQKRFDEVLSELIITEELSMLRENIINSTAGFCELKSKFYLQGQYPAKLLTMWDKFHEEKGSENDRPDVFGTDQRYLVLELAHAGEPVEAFSFYSPQQALAVFLQTTFSLAVAESATDFEHRDLHIGNVLIQKTSEKYINFVLNGTKFGSPTNGVKVTIIDYTLSRISFKGDVIYLDLEKDPELFTAKGEYQFDIYREMRKDLNNNWRDHQPKTNVRWLHYLIEKCTTKIKYKQKIRTKLYKEYMGMLVRLQDIILDFYSASDLAQHLIDSYSQVVSLIKR